MPTFQTLLIANRGEIARRVIRAARTRGLRTVAVYSEADRLSPHVFEADTAVCIGPASATESYLSIPALLAAAERSGADAIHPGYGFLSENAKFAQACLDAKLTWVGPPPQTMELLASKERAKELAAKAGVPTLESLCPETVGDGDFPVLLKPSAGGGGKGMKVVHSTSELHEALAETQRLAMSTFGDDKVLIEPYLSSPRHIEVQILADESGAALHLFERECSIQRRHQKIIEEAPAPHLSSALRNELTDAALRLIRACDYVGAGTVEFLVPRDGDHRGRFYFLEVNTRLQVEHPVTEETTGVDLVDWQLRIAAGENLEFDQKDLVQKGHCLECRLYAEDPSSKFLPSGGIVRQYRPPTGPGVRIDDSVRAGSEISSSYDPMLAKLIVWAPDRGTALGRARRALEDWRISGLTTNRAFLQAILRDEEFQGGRIDTGYLERSGDQFTAPPSSNEIERALIAATVASVCPHSPASAAHSLPSGFRNNRGRGQRRGYALGETELWLEYELLAANSMKLEFPVVSPACFAVIPEPFSKGREPREYWVRWSCEGTRDDEKLLLIEINGCSEKAWVLSHDGGVDVFCGGLEFEFTPLSKFPSPQTEAGRSSLKAPMPAKVIELCAQEGQELQKGQPLLRLEAMKMEHVVTAPCDGRLRRYLVETGSQVSRDQLLIELDEEIAL